MERISIKVIEESLSWLISADLNKKGKTTPGVSMTCG